jgi:hypothetical protein
MLTYGCNHMLIHCGYYIVFEEKFLTTFVHIIWRSHGKVRNQELGAYPSTPFPSI